MSPLPSYPFIAMVAYLPSLAAPSQYHPLHRGPHQYCWTCLSPSSSSLTPSASWPILFASSHPRASYLWPAFACVTQIHSEGRSLCSRPRTWKLPWLSILVRKWQQNRSNSSSCLGLAQLLPSIRRQGPSLGSSLSIGCTWMSALNAVELQNSMGMQ